MKTTSAPTLDLLPEGVAADLIRRSGADHLTLVPDPDFPKEYVIYANTRRGWVREVGAVVDKAPYRNKRPRWEYVPMSQTAWQSTDYGEPS